jgi:hypothetical protein
MNRRATLACLFIGLAGYPLRSTAWEGKHDNKPIAELRLMNEDELATEAQRACSEGARAKRLKQSGTPYEATDYLTTIGRVARRRANGTEPSWVHDMRLAVDDGNSVACAQIWTSLRSRHHEEPAERAPTPPTKRSRFPQRHN